MSNHILQSKKLLAIVVILSVIIIDQIVKIWVKTHFYLGESLEIASWFQISFIENNGMAFGMELGSKLFLTLFRIIVVASLIYYIIKLVKKRFIPKGYIACIALIIAGAAGNIFDCIFYGIIFNNPAPPEIAVFTGGEYGYAPLFYGKVVDMLYFPLFSFTWPDWIPWIGGQHFMFFEPVFNIADAAISVGMIIVILFYHKYIGPFNEVEKKLCPESQIEDRKCDSEI